MTPKVRSFDVGGSEASALLPGWDFADGYEVTVAEGDLQPAEATRRVFLHTAGWINALLRLRNVLVRPFGLKVDLGGEEGSIGGFPIMASTTEHIILGVDDRHLDFRVLVSTRPEVQVSTLVRVVTVVRTRNAFGRVYLAAVIPFHRQIVPRMLARVRLAYGVHP